MYQNLRRKGGAVVAERSRALLHGMGGPRFKFCRVPSIFEARSHWYLKPGPINLKSGPINLKSGPINFKDPPHLEEIESEEEMESRERRWKSERGDGKRRLNLLTSWGLIQHIKCVKPLYLEKLNRIRKKSIPGGMPTLKKIDIQWMYSVATTKHVWASMASE